MSSGAYTRSFRMTRLFISKLKIVEVLGYLFGFKKVVTLILLCLFANNLIFKGFDK